jgi:hypothetical protein
MQKHLFLIPVLILTFFVIVQAQPAGVDTDKLYAILLPDYKYDATEAVYTASEGHKYKFNRTEFVELEGKTLLVALLQSAESYDRFNELHLFEYEQQKKKFTVKQHIVVRENWMTELSVGATSISPQKEALEITSGYDSDGDGDEIFYNIFAYIGGTLSSVLDHTLRTDSGDGCEGEDMESTITASEESTDGFVNFNVEETTSTFNDCDESSTESCTKTSRYTYTWRGNAYQRD